MKLPNHALAVITEQKITGYLLSFSHRDGRGKAVFFTRFGFSAHTWSVLARAPRQHAADHEVARVESSPFGTRYIIEGALLAPDGRTPVIRAV